MNGQLQRHALVLTLLTISVYGCAEQLPTPPGTSSSSDTNNETSTSTPAPSVATTTGTADDFDYVLKKYVKGDFFDYATLKGNAADLARFEGFMRWQAEADVKSMTGDEQIAFYINAYNACCIKAILDNYPVHTPMDVDGFFDKLKFKVGGEMLKIGGSDGDSIEFISPHPLSPRERDSLQASA